MNSPFKTVTVLSLFQNFNTYVYIFRKSIIFFGLSDGATVLRQLFFSENVQGKLAEDTYST